MFDSAGPPKELYHVHEAGLGGCGRRIRTQDAERGALLGWIARWRVYSVSVSGVGEEGILCGIFRVTES
jgi:hypothetical protein